MRIIGIACTFKSRPALIGLLSGILFWVSPAGYGAMTLQRAQQLAVNADTGIDQALQAAESMRADASAKSQLPDPVLILGAQNIPTDTFRFDQEPMTQFRVGVRQMFPQGDSLALQELKYSSQAASQQNSAQTRYLQVQRQVSEIWLETLFWVRARMILDQDEELFRQLLDVTHSMYSVGKVQQQDVLRAELELSRLQEKQIKANRAEQTQRAMLARWVGAEAQHASWPETIPEFSVPDTLITFYHQQQRVIESTLVASELMKHPMLSAMDQQVDEAGYDVKLAESQYSPNWGFELSYGYRDGNNNDGSPRSDLVSAMVTLSMPIFASSRQDKSVQSSSYRQQSRRYALQDQLRQMSGGVDSLLSQLAQVDDQLRLFDQDILSKSSRQAEASLNAYQSGAASFGDVMRGYLGEQKDQLDYQRLLIDRQRLIAEMQFYFPSTIPDLNDRQGERH